MPPTLNLKFGRRSGAEVVGLDIQPGFIAAVKAHVNGAIVAEKAAWLPINSDVVREGEVIDEAALSTALRELFDGSGLGRRVRVGVANQRTVMRTLELPEMSDRKELAAAVNFQAQDQVPMPLANAVLDFHSLGLFDTPEGPRQRVVLVAAQRDMIERLLAAVRGAGLQPEGIDLSAFALIRSLYRPGDENAGRVLYLNVDGLTNLAIADGTACSFTRVVGSGLEGMAAELAERRGIPVTDARQLIANFDLSEPTPGEAAPLAPEPIEPEQPEPQAAISVEEHTSREIEASYTELVAAEAAQPVDPVLDDEDVRVVLENGIREISGEVRNSLDFHRSQGQGGEVSHVALSGAALGLGGFVEALQGALDVEVCGQTVAVADASIEEKVSTNRIAVAVGLAVAEAPQ